MIKVFNEYINESVRDEMKSKSIKELEKTIKSYFDRAENDDKVSVKIDEGEDWKNAAEIYHLYDSFYVYNGYIYTFEFFEYYYEYVLKKTTETSIQFRQKLEKALEKL